jgi:hypothetical protein
MQWRLSLRQLAIAIACSAQLVPVADAQGDVSDLHCDVATVPAIYQAAIAACPGWAHHECPVECAMALAPLMIGSCHNHIHRWADPADPTHTLGPKVDSLWVACLQLDTVELRAALRATQDPPCEDRPPRPPPPPRGNPSPPPNCQDDDHAVMDATDGQGPNGEGWTCAGIRDQGACSVVIEYGWCDCSCPPPDPNSCKDDDARVLAATPGQGPGQEGYTCATLAATGQCAVVHQLGWCECSCPLQGHRRERRLQSLEQQYEDNQNLLEAYLQGDGSVCDIVAPPPPPVREEPLTCEDSPGFRDAMYGNDCMPFALHRDLCASFVDVRGVSAAEACPVSCRTGCILTHDDCQSHEPTLNPCQNGGICFDGVGSFGCQCPAGYCGTSDCSLASTIPFDSTGQCPCADSPTYREMAYTGGQPCDMFRPDEQGGRFNGLCHVGQDSSGTTPAEACPNACETGCASAYDNCIDNPCANGGECTDAQGFAICTCPDHLASDDKGDRCTDECENNPCLNGGVCIDGIGEYSCQCADGWSGPICENSACDDCRQFTGSDILTVSSERSLVSLMPRSLTGNRWERCYSTLLHDPTPAEFHRMCDAYETTILLIQHAPTPETDTRQEPGGDVERLSAGPAWEEGARWIFGGVSFQSWGMDACCAETLNMCVTIDRHDPPFCVDYTHSETFLFRLEPGRPQRYDTVSSDPTYEGYNHYRTLGPAWWPAFGYGYDLTLGNGDGGHCDPQTFSGVQNEICGGNENWRQKVMEVWGVAR